MTHLADEQAIRVSVFPDGAGWLCTVEWPDGTKLTRERTFHIAGFPSVVVTTDHEALKCLMVWLQQRPQDWRKPRKAFNA